MPSLFRGVLPLVLLVGFSSAATASVWIESFTGMLPGEKPNGYRYNEGALGDFIQIFFAYTRVTPTAGADVFINGLPTQFSCTFSDTPGGGTGSCFGFVPYFPNFCGKMTVVVRHFQPRTRPRFPTRSRCSSITIRAACRSVTPASSRTAARVLASR